MMLQRYESEMLSRGNTAAADRARKIIDEYGDIPLEDEALVTSLITPEEIDAFAGSVSSRFNRIHTLETPLAEPLSHLMTAALEIPEAYAVALVDRHKRTSPTMDVFFICPSSQNLAKEREVARLHADMFRAIPGIDSSIYFPISPRLMGPGTATPSYLAELFVRLSRESGNEGNLIGFAKFDRE